MRARNIRTEFPFKIEHGQIQGQVTKQRYEMVWVFQEPNTDINFSRGLET